MVSPKLIIGLLILILSFHILATLNSWYWIFTWLDMPMHFLGGFWLAVVFMWLNSKFNIIEIRPPNIDKLILVLGFVILVGVFWEFFEFGYDVLISSKGYFAAAQQGTADTMSDLFFDLLGGLVFLIICRFYINKESHSG
jgi:uncharacterized membrane protein YjdF